ncbi:hypothetical protein [Rudanella paleaurantiibacter]|uniref:hypothetical protein n=1 Tax=Rudanella paleaurantiibacter TaxID=2614655 RepID=UPI001629E2DD|nr:hypothetical protein [Rudanella paleaurantiibacter]
MDKVLTLLEAYLKSRNAILWACADRPMSVQTSIDLLKTTATVIHKRRKDPKSWRPSELIVLGERLNINTVAIANLRSLTLQLTTMPEETIRPVMKAAHLDRKKLIIRNRNYDNWQHDELERLALVLRNWKPLHLSKKTVLHHVS